MDLMQFHQMRTAVQIDASPGRSGDLRAVERTLGEMLLDSGLFEDVEVEHTDDVDKLVIALCRFRPFYTERDVAERLEEIWSDKVRYPFWARHAVLAEQDHVELEGASRVGPKGHYVTVHLVAQRARIPEQRRPPV
jgi:hypothetical protein